MLCTHLSTSSSLTWTLGQSWPFPLNLVHVSQCGLLSQNLSDVDWALGPWARTLPSSPGLSSGLSPPGTRSEFLLTFFVPPQSSPSQGFWEWVVHYLQHHERIILFFSPWGFDFSNIYVMICSGWVSWKRFHWVKTARMVLFKAALLLFTLFPKGQLNICPQRSECSHKWV